MKETGKLECISAGRAGNPALKLFAADAHKPLVHVRFLLYIEFMRRNPTRLKGRNKVSDTRAARRQPRKNEANDFALQLRLPAPLHQQMRERAQRETLSINAWIRLACKKELRRKFLV
jgi:hypothetical protein